MRGSRAGGSAAVLILAAVLEGPAAGAQATPSAIPSNLAIPAGSVSVFTADARGVQIYVCGEDPEAAGTFAWVFEAPEAELLNADGDRIGSHYAGPTWEGNDGSTVVGEVLERADSLASGTIPWLLLEAAENGGTGVFATATYVQRLDTAGGAAPETGCDEGNLDDELRVPYTATYAFAYPAAGA